MGFSAHYLLQNSCFALIESNGYACFLDKIILLPGSRAITELKATVVLG